MLRIKELRKRCHRSTLPEVFCIKGVLRISRSSYENACAGVFYRIKQEVYNFVKNTLALVFSYVLCEVLRTPSEDGFCKKAFDLSLCF